MNKHTTPLPSLTCMCASFRRTARALTRHYDRALRPLGLRATQFTALQALARAGALSQRHLGRLLVMDSTTLTRNLGVLRRRGWVARRRGRDRREWRLSLTPAGEARLRRALPRWERVQERLRRRLGEGRWNHLLQWTNQVTTAVAE